MHYSTVRLFVVIVALTLVSAACGGDNGASDEPAAGTSTTAASTETSSGTAPDEPLAITIAIETEPTTIDPQLTQEGGMRRVMENVYEPLIDRDLVDPSILVPQLAAELPTLIDDTTWEVKIREGVSFHNGEPFNAEAARFSIARAIDPETDSEYLGLIDTIAGVEVIDDYTIRITTSKPDPILASRLYFIAMLPPEHATNNDITVDAVGTGPYMMVEWVPGDHFDLAMNPEYWGDEPQVDQVRFVFLPASQTRVAALQAGDVQLSTGIPPESAGQVPQIITREGLEYPYLRMKTYEGPLQSLDLRRAIAHAINVDEYIEFIYGSQAARVNCQPFGSGVIGYNPDLTDYEYDPALAESLVASSGYDGTPLSFVAPRGRWLKFEEMAEAIRSDLAAVGITLDFQLIAFEPWLNAFLTPYGPGQPDIVLSSMSNEILDADKVSVFIGTTGQASSYPNDELAALMTEARGTFDLERRAEIYQEVMATNCEEVGLLPILTFLESYGAAENLEWTPRFDGTTRVADMVFK